MAEKVKEKEKAKKEEEKSGKAELSDEETDANNAVLVKNLDKEFKEHSVAEFFKKNKQMLGLYGKVRTLTMVIHEYVTNSLDACEEANILPEIDVKIDELGPEYYQVTVTDNGPGISKENVGKAFGKLLAGTKFHRLIQARGQQGIGCSGCTMLSQMTTGKPSKIITGRKGQKAMSLEVSVDPKDNEPKISNMQELGKDFQGTAVQAKFKNIVYRESEQGPMEYLRRTAIANPHAQISFRDPAGKKVVFKRTGKEIPKPPQEIKPHPKGSTIDDLLSLSRVSKARTVSSFLSTDFDRMGAKAADEVKKRVNFDMAKDPKKLGWDEAEEIIKAFKEIDFIAPSTDALRPIGEERIKNSLQSIVQPEFLTVLTRKPAVYAGGFPFQIEIGIAYGGNAGRAMGEEKKIEIMRFANKSPLLFDPGSCALTKAVQTVDWKRYGIKDVEQAPLTVLVNFISVHIPYTGAGKQAIADEEEVLEEIRLALMQTGRRAGIYISKRRREQENQLKRELFYKYIPEIVEALHKLTGESKASMQKRLEKIVLEKLKLEDVEEAKKSKAENKAMKELDSDSTYIQQPKKENKKEKNAKGGK
ncbi:MAG: DNA topoisomerase VI subunit B [Candidatus Diapherotrites archaeon]|nr:DNA topoisomerase VI subunit B [Candidatus Diapherotrites archaeon]